MSIPLRWMRRGDEPWTMVPLHSTEPVGPASLRWIWFTRAWGSARVSRTTTPRASAAAWALMMLVGSSVSDGGGANHLGFPAANFTVKLHVDLGEVRGKHLSGKPAQLASQRHVRRNLFVFHIGERWQVYRILRDALDEVIAHLFGNLNSDSLLAFLGGSSKVRRGQQVGSGEQSGVAGRLLVENIERGGGHVSERSAASTAASSTSSPRAQFNSRTPGFMLAMVSALIMPAVW
jgi:hypothetical protein